MTITYGYAKTPIGRLLIAVCEEGVVRIAFEREKIAAEPQAHWRHDEASVAAVKAQLAEYFDGKRRDFDLPLAPAGTDFQKEVWSALCTIRYGETRSYGEIAASIGRPQASRAVGAANGANPIPIVVPCHRVIGASGDLTGFGGGLEVKRFLLALERGDARASVGQQSLAFAK
jgi:methylated-DNA-[protein]-cysteine S-methyltransferase